MAHVVVRDRTGKILQKVTLADKSIVIGRSAECDVRVTDTRASREHCELVPVGDGWVLRDRGSRNGTYVNGKSVREHHLRDGDMIEVGSHRVGFFTAKARRERAADPVRAGLVDAESQAGHGPGAWEPPGSVSTESSLFATRVMVAASEESTVAGEGVLSSRSSMDIAPVVPVRNPVGRPVRSVGKKWGTLVGALGLVATSVVIWLYWG